MLAVCVIYEGELLSNVTNTDVRLLSIDGRLLAAAFGNQGSGCEEFVVQFIWSQRITELKISLLTAANVSFYVGSITTNGKGIRDNSVWTKVSMNSFTLTASVA